MSRIEMIQCDGRRCEEMIPPESNGWGKLDLPNDWVETYDHRHFCGGCVVAAFDEIHRLNVRIYHLEADVSVLHDRALRRLA